MTITVCKRDGRLEPFDLDKIELCLSTLAGLGKKLHTNELDLKSIATSVALGVYDNVTTEDINSLIAENCANRTLVHYDYSKLAARVAVVALHKHTSTTFSAAMDLLYHNKAKFAEKNVSLISENLYKIVCENRHKIDMAIAGVRDFDFEYFGFKTLERSYLLRINRKIVERPQYLFMRVALGVHGDDLDRAFETYDLMSKKYFTHGSPTLFNAGTRLPQMSSCFLLGMQDDSIDGIYQTLRKCANISKAAGGIGIHCSNIRAAGSFVAGTNGTSNGIIPMLKVFNDTARFVDQGGSKRPGAFAIYLEPWHADIFEFLNLRKNHGKEESRARDLFYALWIPDLFMERVERNETWHLFSPDEAPGLDDVYGDEFKDLYGRYVSEKRYRREVPAQKLWSAILDAQTETGTPFMLYKDACNRKSNQKNLGTIKSSNLCTEIIEYSSKDETAVCNLASVALPSFLKYGQDDVVWYDFGLLHSVVKKIVYNLDLIIDNNQYPTKDSKSSNFRNRPIAIGVQGLADLFCELRLPFDSDEARKLNIQIFETIYHAAVEKSIDLAKHKGHYASFYGSPTSQSLLQFDLWDHEPTSMYDWDKLKVRMSKYGIRNSLLVAPMPTASTSQILGFSESFEPYTSNVYTRRVVSGEFQVVNKWMVQDLIDLGLWTPDVRNRLIKYGGSIQDIQEIPKDIRKLYRTVWELSQRSIIDMSADRGPFVDQSQSLNIYMKSPTVGKLTSMHFYGWKKGLKTGMYYFRTQAASAAIQFTVDQEMLIRSRGESEENSQESPESSRDFGQIKRAKYLEYSKSFTDSPVSSSASLSGQEAGLDSVYDIMKDDTPFSCPYPNSDVDTDCEACSG